MRLCPDGDGAAVHETAYTLAVLASESRHLSEVATAIARGKAGAPDWIVARDVLAADLDHEDRVAVSARRYGMAMRVRAPSRGITSGHPNADSAAANAFIAWFMTPPVQVRQILLGAARLENCWVGRGYSL